MNKDQNRSTSISPEHIRRLWLRMTEIYGHKWTSAHGESDESGTWLDGLSDMRPENIRNGLRACLTSQEAWPPTLPMFRAMCKPCAHPSHVETKALPRPEVDPDMQAELMRKMKDMLK